MSSQDSSLWVTGWWLLLIALATLNSGAWLTAAWRFLSGRSRLETDQFLWRRWHVLLSAGYVFGCAFRSIFPRVDVQRLCLYNSWISSVFLGRTVATVAELFFVSQWALLLSEYGEDGRDFPTRVIARLLVPLIVVAEICSWYSVLTTNFLGHVFEESIWAVTTALTVLALAILWPKVETRVRKVFAAALVFASLYILYMVTVDVPMYLSRWRADAAAGKIYLTLSEGLSDALFRRNVTWQWTDWRDEIAWMSLYFSLAVWVSILFIQAPRLNPARAKTRS